MGDYHRLSSSERRSDPTASSRLATLSARLAGAAGAEPDVQERRRLVDTLLDDLDAQNSQASWRSWQDSTVLMALSALKLLGRTPVGTTSLATKASLATLAYHAGLTLSAHPPAPRAAAQQIFDEATRILANTLLLHPLARVEEGVWTETICEELVTRALPLALPAAGASAAASPLFLPSRLLWLLTASPCEAVVVLVDGTSLIARLVKALESVVVQLQGRDMAEPASVNAVDEQIWTDWLKLLFNITIQYPRSLALWPRVVSPSPSPSPVPSPRVDQDIDSASEGHSGGPADDADMSSSPPVSDLAKSPRSLMGGQGSFLRRAASPVQSSASMAKAASQPGRSRSPAWSPTPSETDTLHVPDVYMTRSDSTQSAQTLRSEPQDPRSRQRVFQRLVDGVGELGGRMLGKTSGSNGSSGRSRSQRDKRSRKRRQTGASDSTVDTSVPDIDVKFEATLPPVVDIFLLLRVSEPPALQAPLMPVIQSFLNFSPSQPAFARPLPERAPAIRPFAPSNPTSLPPMLSKAVLLVDSALAAYATDDGTFNEPAWAGASSTPLSESLTQVLLLLSSLVAPNASISPSQRSALREAIVPSSLDRTRGLDRGHGELFIGRLLRVMNAAMGAGEDNLKAAIGSFLIRLWDNDAAKLVSAIGYAPLAGYLASIGQAGVQADPTTLRDDINPITGARWPSPPQEEASEMTEEEKAQEAQRLGELFDRLNRTGVMKVQDPRQVAVQEGRFQELEEAEDRDAREAEERELEEAEAEMKRYKGRQASKRG